MNIIVRWLESPEGEAWSRATHERVKHHAILEDHPDLPMGHYPGVTFMNPVTGDGYQESDICECLGGTKAFYATKGTWWCAPHVHPPVEWFGVPYDPEVRF